jgi:hypothetical protein
MVAYMLMFVLFRPYQTRTSLYNFTAAPLTNLSAYVCSLSLQKTIRQATRQNNPQRTQQVAQTGNNQARGASRASGG